MSIPPEGATFRILGSEANTFISTATLHREIATELFTKTKDGGKNDAQLFILVAGTGKHQGTYLIRGKATNKPLFSRDTKEPYVGYSNMYDTDQSVYYRYHWFKLEPGTEQHVNQFRLVTPSTTHSNNLALHNRSGGSAPHLGNDPSNTVAANQFFSFEDISVDSPPTRPEGISSDGIPLDGIPFRLVGLASNDVIYSRTHRTPEVGTHTASVKYSDHYFTLVSRDDPRGYKYSIKSKETGKYISSLGQSSLVGHTDDNTQDDNWFQFKPDSENPTKQFRLLTRYCDEYDQSMTRAVYLESPEIKSHNVSHSKGNDHVFSFEVGELPITGEPTQPSDSKGIPDDGVPFRIVNSASNVVIYSRIHQTPEVGAHTASDNNSDHYFTLVSDVDYYNNKRWLIKSEQTGKFLSLGADDKLLAHTDGNPTDENRFRFIESSNGQFAPVTHTPTTNWLHLKFPYIESVPAITAKGISSNDWKFSFEVKITPRC